MADIYARKIAGERLRMPADIYNRFLSTIQYVEQLRRGQKPDTQRMPRDCGLVCVKNASGAAVARFAVLGIDGMIAATDPANNVESFKNGPCLSGRTPALETHRGKFVIVLQPLAADAIGWAVASGVVPVKVDFTYAGQPYADAKDTDKTALAGGEGGAAQVLWKESGTGAKWALVRVGMPTYPKLLGKLDGDLTQATGSATMSVWEGSTLADSGRNVTVYDWFLATGKKIASGAKVAAEFKSGKWYVDTTGTCPS